LNLSNLVKSALAVASSVAPLIPYGPEAMAAVKAVRGLLDDTKETVAADPAAVAELEAGREEFEKAVNAHADSTAEKLG
jgi:hypothetical protein